MGKKVNLHSDKIYLKMQQLTSSKTLNRKMDDALNRHFTKENLQLFDR